MEHSVGVMQTMGELAEVYGLDREKAQSIGLLHDAGKDLPPGQQKQLIREGRIEIRYPCDNDYNLYLHGPVGSYFVQKELGITDQLILDAITMHTFAKNGENFNHPMVWCLRFSDILEPNRDWDAVKWLRDRVEILRELAFAGRMVEGAFLQTSCLVTWFEEVGMPVHPNMRRVKDEVTAQLNVDGIHEIK